MFALSGFNKIRTCNHVYAVHVCVCLIFMCEFPFKMHSSLLILLITSCVPIVVCVISSKFLLNP